VVPAAAPTIRQHAAAPLSHGPYQRAKQRLTAAATFLAWLADRGHQLGECTQHDLDSWLSAGPSTRQNALTFLSWARRQRILRGIELPVIHTEAGAAPPAPAVRLAAIRRLLLDDALALDDRIAGCLVVLYGQQASRIAALRVSDVSCADAAIRLRLGADGLDVPEPVAALLWHHLRNRATMTTAAGPASPWLFPGQLAGEQRSYRRLIVILNRLGIPARASRPAAWHQLARQAPPAVLAGALGVSPDTATRHALVAGADWATYASRRSSPAAPEYDGLPQYGGLPLWLPAQAGFRSLQASAGVSFPALRNRRLRRPNCAAEVCAGEGRMAEVGGCQIDRLPIPLRDSPFIFRPGSVTPPHHHHHHHHHHPPHGH